jgi:hypothetical protein
VSFSFSLAKTEKPTVQEIIHYLRGFRFRKRAVSTVKEAGAFFEKKMSMEKHSHHQ